MFGRFFGKGKKVPGTSGKDALDSRGLEINEGDQETAWGLWESALAEQDPRFNAAEMAAIRGTAPQAPPPSLAPLSVDIDLEVPTQPMSLTEKPTQRRKDNAMRLVEAQHPRIALAIQTLWGHKECSAYIGKLIMDSNDGMGQARAGFNQQTAAAMIYLADLHDAEFGFDADDASGFANTTQVTSWGKLR
jgi:hypothetical protein